jgi:hypothetical protein
MESDLLTDYEEISQNEYRRLKRDNSENYHSYTARIQHRYFKKKQKYPLFFGENCVDFKVKLTGNGWIDIISDGNIIPIGNLNSLRVHSIKQAIEKAEEMREK